MSIMKWVILAVVTIFTLCVGWIVGAALAGYFNNFVVGWLFTIFVCWFMGRGVGAEVVKYL